MLEQVMSDARYVYDGSLAGFYCCVYESVYTRACPQEISAERDLQPSFFAPQRIATDVKRARRVRESVYRLTPRAQELVEVVFLSCIDQKELRLLQFLLLLYREGREAIDRLGHPLVAPLWRAHKHYWREQHLLLGFVRFVEYDGLLVATITPKNFVLPHMVEHFTARFPKEEFLIYDKTHGAALLYAKGKAEIVEMQDLALKPPDEREKNYQALWKNFYDTVAIKARTNHKCRRAHMPQRYWENMLEVQDLVK